MSGSDSSWFRRWFADDLLMQRPACPAALCISCGVFDARQWEARIIANLCCKGQSKQIYTKVTTPGVLREFGHGPLLRQCHCKQSMFTISCAGHPDSLPLLMPKVFLLSTLFGRAPPGRAALTLASAARLSAAPTVSVILEPA